MAEPIDALLTKAVPYAGEGISVASLEAALEAERRRQDGQVVALQAVQQRNVEVSASLAQELQQLQRLSGYLSQDG